MKAKLLCSGALLAALAVAVWSVKRVPQPPQFCDECVMSREVADWRLCGRWNLFSTSAVNATPVSELLQQHHASATHEHKWSAPVYVAETELETSEAPRVRSLGLLNAPRAVNFLRGVFDYTDATNLASWRGVAWQPAFASALEPALRFARFPENGFATRAEFLAWWQQNSHPLFNHLNAMTVAD